MGSQPASGSAAATPATGSDASATGSAAAAAAALSAESLATSAKPSFWRRMTDALGVDKKSEEHSGAAAPTEGSTRSAGAPAAGAGSLPAAAVVASTATQPQVRAAGSPPGPQYRQGAPVGAPSAPADPAASPGQPAGSATALLPAVAAGGAAAKAGEAAPPSQSRPGAAHRTRKARLRLSRLDPWSVMKTSFLFSIAAGIMLVVAVYAVWVVLSTSGLFSSVNGIVAAVLSSPGDTTPFRVENYLSTQRVTGAAAVIAVVDVALFTALATLGSFLYNLAATMLGGLEVTLAED